MDPDVKSPKAQPSTSSSSSSEGWQQRIAIPTIIGGVVGGLFGLVSRRRRPLTASYAANLAIVTACYCGTRELARDARASDPDDLFNSVIGGVASGALLGRLQGGQLGAIRYAILFASLGTAVDFATMQLRPYLQGVRNTAKEMRRDPRWWSLPEWSPVQILDQEALAAKRAREEQLYVERRFGVNKDES